MCGIHPPPFGVEPLCLGVVLALGSRLLLLTQRLQRLLFLGHERVTIAPERPQALQQRRGVATRGRVAAVHRPLQLGLCVL